MSEVVESMPIPLMTFEQLLELQAEAVFSIYETLTLFMNRKKAEQTETAEVQLSADAKQFYYEVVEVTEVKLHEASFDRILEFTNYPDSILGNASNSISQLAEQELQSRISGFCRQG